MNEGGQPPLPWCFLCGGEGSDSPKNYVHGHAVANCDKCTVGKCRDLGGHVPGALTKPRWLGEVFMGKIPFGL